jgi:hypothetical protein
VLAVCFPVEVAPFNGLSFEEVLNPEQHTYDIDSSVRGPKFWEELVVKTRGESNKNNLPKWIDQCNRLYAYHAENGVSYCLVRCQIDCIPSSFRIVGKN